MKSKVNIDSEMEGIKDAAQHLGALELSFVAACAYLAFAAAGTTHVELLLGKRFNLPVINSSIGLKSFFVLASLLVLVFHGYILMMQGFLQRAIRLFLRRLGESLAGEPVTEEGECEERPDETLEEKKLRQALERKGAVPPLPGLVGGLTLPLCHSSWAVLMLFGLLWIVDAGVPLATLIILEQKFLPYRSVWVTGAQMALIIIDLFFILMAFRKIECTVVRLRRPPKVRWLTRTLEGICVLGGILASLLLTALLIPVAPSEDANLLQRSANGLSCINLTDAELVRNVPGISELNRSGRKEDIPLRFAIGADLRRRNLQGANLRRAVLVNADLRYADLRYSNLNRADLRQAELEGTNFEAAKLRQADLGGATGDEKTSFAKADLQGARLSGGLFRDSVFRETDLLNAEMEGGDFTRADFSGARLERARLNGSRMNQAFFNGAVAPDIKAQGSDWKEADLFLGRFAKASLPGVEFSVKETRGLLLRNADLRGLYADSIQYSDLGAANVWQTYLKEGVLGVDLRQVKSLYSDPEGEDCIQTENLFWKCQREYLDRLYRQVERKNGDRAREEIRDVWNDRKQRMQREEEREKSGPKRATRLVPEEADLAQLALAFDAAEPTRGWDQAATLNPEEVYEQTGVEVLEAACGDAKWALALVRELARCYEPEREPYWRRGVYSQFQNRQPQSGCRGIDAVIKNYGLPAMEDFRQTDPADLAQVCPAWKAPAGKMTRAKG